MNDILSHSGRLLAERYGQPYKIASAYVDRVIHGQPIHGEDGATLQKFSILLTGCSNTLRGIGENPDSLRKIVDWLPYTLKLKWCDVVDYISQREARDPTLNDLTNFVEARSRVANHPIFGKIYGNQKPHTPGSTSNQRKGARSFGMQGKQSNQPKCPSCQKNHWLSQCDDFKKLRIYDRHKFVRDKNLCLNCLAPGHFVQDCPKKSFCRIQGCNENHYTFFHSERRREQKEAQKSANSKEDKGKEPTATVKNGYIQGNVFQASNDSSVVGLAIVPVKVRVKGQEANVLTYAFLDAGSNTSFCTEDLLKKLNVTGEKANLSLTTLQTENKPIECSLVNLEVSDLCESATVELPMVYSRPSLPVSTDTIGTQEDLNRWPYLKGIEIPSINAEIGLLVC